MASVIGLAPIRPDLKGRLRELLCVHGRLVWLASRSRAAAVKPAFARSSFGAAALAIAAIWRRLVPEVGIAPTSPRLQRGANLPQLLAECARRAEARRAKAGRPAR